MAKKSDKGEDKKIEELREHLKVYDSPQFIENVINVAKEYTAETKEEDFNALDIWEIVKTKYELGGEDGERFLRDILWTWHCGPM